MHSPYYHKNPVPILQVTAKAAEVLGLQERSQDYLVGEYLRHRESL